jgi:hypothetical protein
MWILWAAIMGAIVGVIAAWIASDHRSLLLSAVGSMSSVVVCIPGHAYGLIGTGHDAGLLGPIAGAVIGLCGWFGVSEGRRRS